MSWWHPAPDTAASEVVGYVLITGISILAITAVMLTSGPALEKVQSSQQHDAMLRYFHDLDQGFSMLLSGVPSGSTPVWSVSMSQGSISLDSGGDQIWVYATDKDIADNPGSPGSSERTLWYRGFSDGDPTFTADLDGSSLSNSLAVEAYRWQGATKTELSTSISGSAPEWDISATLGGKDVYLDDNTTEWRFYDTSNPSNPSGPPFARAWIIDGGAVEWQRSGADFQRILYQNTAIVALIDDGQVMHNDPRLKEIDTSGSTDHAFIRLANIDGTVSLGGQTSASVLLSSEGNHPRHASSKIEQVQLYPPTSTTTAWKRLLTDADTGYGYEWIADPDSGGGEPAAIHNDGGNHISVTMVETNVHMTLQGGV